MERNNPFLDAAIKETEERGERATLLDRAHDRHFCKMIGVNYTAKDIYTQIKDKVEEYRRKQNEKSN